MTELFPNALDAGVSVSEFWELSIAEINNIIASYKRKEVKRFKEKVQLCFLQADVIGNALFRQENEKKIQPWDVYPAIFKEEKQQFEEYVKKEELETFKERRRAWMDRYNAKQKEVTE